jgi:hypothetical protein
MLLNTYYLLCLLLALKAHQNGQHFLANNIYTKSIWYDGNQTWNEIKATAILVFTVVTHSIYFLYIYGVEVH